MDERRVKDALQANRILDCLSASERKLLLGRVPSSDAAAPDSQARLSACLTERQTRAIVHFIVEVESAAERPAIDIANRLLNDISYALEQRVSLLDRISGLVSQYEEFFGEAQREFYGDTRCSRLRQETLAEIEAEIRNLGAVD